MGLLGILFPKTRGRRPSDARDKDGRDKTVAVEGLLVPGETTDVRVRRNPRARRISVRVDAADGTVALTVPWHTPVEEGLRFARRQGDWLRARLAAVPARIEFADGAAFEFLGARLTVRRAAGRLTKREGDVLLVGGAPEFVARRVRDWLKREARTLLTAKAHALAARVGRKVKAVRIADPRTRWGSAASDGTLAFSWRLVLSPPEVLDYVVAHEVAHLRHMNHGAHFWALVGELAGDVTAPRAWLAANGAKLLRHG
ncbi:MAG: M48 family metallopeptidase [Proteobacteria bacterium]|nr:M48 family metallopeptidase [Pseudomonadota bacterium]